MPESEFKVSFGRTARTLVYEDHLGVLLFAFDVSPSEESEGTWNLHLGNQPLNEDGTIVESIDSSDRQRIAVAIDRTRQYASSRGYHVEE